MGSQTLGVWCCENCRRRAIDAGWLVVVCSPPAPLWYVTQHDNELIYAKAVEIIEKYYSAEDEDDDENIAPSATGDQFTFGVSSNVRAQSHVGVQLRCQFILVAC